MANVFVALVSRRSCFACNFSTLFAFQEVARFNSLAEAAMPSRFGPFRPKKNLETNKGFNNYFQLLKKHIKYM